MSTRAQVRAALKTLFESALVGTGLPVQAILAYPPAKPTGQSPLVYLRSAGARRLPTTHALSAVTYRVDVVVLVLHSDGNTWDADDAEDALDAIEDLIASVIDANQHNARWQALTYAKDSAVDLVAVSGTPHRREIIPLAVQVYT